MNDRPLSSSVLESDLLCWTHGERGQSVVCRSTSCVTTSAITDVNFIEMQIVKIDVVILVQIFTDLRLEKSNVS